jgi:hypothetical protein
MSHFNTLQDAASLLERRCAECGLKGLGKPGLQGSVVSTHPAPHVFWGGKHSTPLDP